MPGRHWAARLCRPLGAIAVLLIAVGPAAAEACPYPLGDHLLTGDAVSFGGDPFDPASQLTDAVVIGTQLAPGQFVYAGGNVQFAFESETDYVIPNTATESEAHVVVYRQFSQRTGWNVRPEFVSSTDTSQPVPSGDHTSPTLVAEGDRAWVIWQVAGPSDGSPAWPDSGSYLLARERGPGGWGPISLLSPTDSVSRSSLPKAAMVGGEPLVVYQTNRFETDSTEFHIAAQTIGAGGPSAIVNVSVANDGWSDEGVALATEGSPAAGTSAAAVWSSRNVSDVFASGASEVRLSFRNAAGVWSAPILVSGPGQDRIDKPAAAWVNGQVVVAWTARDLSVASRGDTSLFLRRVDPLTASGGPTEAVTGEAHRGDEAAPALVPFNGSLHVVWSSTSAEDGSGSTWQVARTFTCVAGGNATCPIRIVDRPDDALFQDLWPGLLVVDDSLVVTYALNFGDFVGTAANQHTVTRVLERGAWPSDTLEASFGMDAVDEGAAGSARLAVRFVDGGGAPAPSDHYALRLSDGNVMRLPAGFSSGEFRVPYQDGALARPVDALWCGQPIPLSQFALGPAPGSGILPAFGADFAILAAVIGAALAVRLSGRRPAGEADDPTNRGGDEG